MIRHRIAPRVLCAKSISKPVVASANDEADPEQFSGWAAEEIEIQRQEKLQRIKEIEEDGEYVPAYLRAVFDAMDEKIIMEETPASKLPVIAVIGRPNTGKSTIVNRLTQSYKVCQTPFFPHSIFDYKDNRFSMPRTERLSTTNRVSRATARTAQATGTTTTFRWWTPVVLCSKTPKTYLRTRSPTRRCSH